MTLAEQLESMWQAKESGGLTWKRSPWSLLGANEAGSVYGLVVKRTLFEAGLRTRDMDK